MYTNVRAELRSTI